MNNSQMLRVLADRRVCSEERELDEMKNEKNRSSHDDLYEKNRRLHLSSNYSFSHPRIEPYQSVLARAYLVSSADNPKGLSAKANPQGLSFGSFTSHNTAEVLRQVGTSFNKSLTRHLLSS
jgi:hypothetical protein